ncbi:MAG TPA: chemotaxis protein CheC [Myxococcales bacterium]|nr:chemotaxis protein CheC [Myxococcales bacterium]
MTAAPWTELQCDALRELGNVGCGRAATALSRLLAGRRILSELPRSIVMAPGALASLLQPAAEPWWIARLTLAGALTGELLCAVPVLSAGEILDRLLSEKEKSRSPSTALSALAEAANIMGSAYLDGAASLTGLPILPSPPSVERETGDELERAWWERPAAERGGLAIATSFRNGEGANLKGVLILIPTLAGTRTLLSAMRLSA